MRTKATSKENNRIAVGYIAGLFGIRGELKCDPTTSGRSLFSAGESFDARLASGSETPVTLRSVREHQDRLLITIDGVDDATAAERFVKSTFYADRSRIELDEGEWLDRDLAGCYLVDPDGTVLGKVQRVEHYPSSDMLIVNGRMVPMVAAFIRSVDISTKRIVAELPPGLLSDED